MVYREHAPRIAGEIAEVQRALDDVSAVTLDAADAPARPSEFHTLGGRGRSFREAQVLNGYCGWVAEDFVNAS